MLEAHLDGEDLLRRLGPLAESSETARVISDVLVIDMSTMQLARRGWRRTLRPDAAVLFNADNQLGTGDRDDRLWSPSRRSSS